MGGKLWCGQTPNGVCTFGLQIKFDLEGQGKKNNPPPKKKQQKKQ